MTTAQRPDVRRGGGVERGSEHVAVLGASLGVYAMARAISARAASLTLVTWPAVTRREACAAPGVDRTVQLSVDPAFAWDPRLDTQEGVEPFLEELTEVCRRQGITRVFAFTDAFVYLLAAHRERLAAHGIVCCVPSLEALRGVQDRFLLAAAARRHGVRVPHVATWDDSVAGIPLPWVAKQRVSAGGQGVRLVRTAAEREQLERDWAEVPREDIGIHEYVPGDHEPSVTLLLASDGRLVTETWLNKVRYASSSTSTCVVTVDRPPGGDAVVEFLRASGLVGIVSAQMKTDERTGEPTLIEVNARPGQNSRILVPLWEREGVPVGAALIGETPVVAPSQTRAGVVGVSPVEDLAAVLKHVARRQGRAHAAAYVRSYVRTLGRRPVVDAWTTAVGRRPWRLGRSVAGQFVRTYREPFDFIAYGDVGVLERGHA